MSEFYELNYQIPWFYIVCMSFMLCGMIGAFLLKFFKLKKAFFPPLFSLVVVIVFVAGAIFSYEKLKEIRSHVYGGREMTLRGFVEKVEEYGGKDIVFISGKIFEIRDHDLYCLNNRNVFKSNKKFELRYIDLGRWVGFEAGYCILSYKELEG